MKLAVYKNTCARAGHPVMDAFIESVKSDNVQVFNNNAVIDCDVAVIWAILWQNKNRQILWDAYHKKNIPVLVLEVGGLKRNEYWKVGINGINNNAIWNNKNSPPDRWNKLNLELKPWKNDGDYILLCGQNDQSGAWPSGLTSEKYTYDTVKELRNHTDRPIWLRPHPRARFNLNQIMNDFPNIFVSTPKQHTGTYDNFDLDIVLKNAWASICYNSNTGIESVMSGTPVFCDQSSLASPVGNLNLANIENPLKPDRTQWSHDIAYTEWSVEEIRQGLPWFRLKPLIKNYV